MKNTVPLLLLSANSGKSGLKTCGFPLFIKVFYSIVVSSLDVDNYASRSSADDFCSKSVRHGLLCSLMSKLAVIKLVIESAALKEGSVITLLDDVAVLHHEYNISLAYC